MTAGRPLNRTLRPTGLPAGFDEGDDSPPYTVITTSADLAGLATVPRAAGCRPARFPDPEETTEP